MNLAKFSLPVDFDSSRAQQFRLMLETVRNDPLSYCREADMIMHALGGGKKGPLLEVAPGLGINFFEIASRGCQIRGIDIREDSVEHLEQLAKFWAPGARIDRGDATELPYLDNSFSGVYAVNVWEHIHDPIGALQECARVLSPSGRIVIIDGNLLSPFTWKLMFIDRSRKNRDPMAGFRWLKNKNQVLESYGNYKGKDEDHHSVWGWRRQLKLIPEFRIVTVTTVGNYRRRMNGLGSYKFLTPFAGRIVVVAEKRG